MKHSLQLAMIHDLAAILNPFGEHEKKVWLDCQAKDITFIQFTKELATFYANGGHLETEDSDRTPPVSFNVQSENIKGENSSLLVEWCIDLKDDSTTFVYMLIEEIHEVNETARLRIHEVSVRRFDEEHPGQDADAVTIYQVDSGALDDTVHDLEVDAELSLEMPAEDNVLLREAFGAMLTAAYLDRQGSYKFRLIKAVLAEDYVEPVEEGESGTEAPATEA